MKLFAGLQKIIVLTFTITLLLIHTNFAAANRASPCDYDDLQYGSGTLEVTGDNYIFNFSSEAGDDYTFTGSIQEPIVGQIQNALANTKPDMQDTTSIALMLSMNKPVCASAIESASLYVQPDIIEKNTYYVVGVCTPETSDCWKMKINKGTYLASKLKKDGMLGFEGKTCMITASLDGEIFSLYEDMNAMNAIDENTDVVASPDSDVLENSLIFLSSEFWQTANLIDVQKAIEHGADVNARDESGMTPLITAIFKNSQPEIIEVLVKGGANVNARDESGMTPLAIAIFKNSHLDTIEVLVKGGANVNARDELGMTPLILASMQNSNPKIIEVLVNHGADVNVRGESGMTPLMVASARNAHPEIIEVLIKHGADVNARGEGGETALILASMQNSNPEIIEVLINRGADVKVRNNDGMTAFDAAKLNDKVRNTKVYWKMNDLIYK